MGIANQQQRGSKMAKKNKYLPTQEQIKQACAELQRRWTPKESEKRRIIKTKQWTPPTVPIEEIDLEFEFNERS